MSDASTTDETTQRLRDAVSSLLPGGTGNCNSGDDRDIGPGGVRGWWVYFNFTAEPVTWSEP